MDKIEIREAELFRESPPLKLEWVKIRSEFHLFATDDNMSNFITLKLIAKGVWECTYCLPGMIGKQAFIRTIKSHRAKNKALRMFVNDMKVHANALSKFIKANHC